MGISLRCPGELHILPGDPMAALGAHRAGAQGWASLGIFYLKQALNCYPKVLGYASPSKTSVSALGILAIGSPGSWVGLCRKLSKGQNRL